MLVLSLRLQWPPTAVFISTITMRRTCPSQPTGPERIKNTRNRTTPAESSLAQLTSYKPRDAWPNYVPNCCLTWRICSCLLHSITAIIANWIFSHCLSFFSNNLKRRDHNCTFYRVAGESKRENAYEVLNKLSDTQEPISTYLLLPLLCARSLYSLSSSMRASVFPSAK